MSLLAMLKKGGAAKSATATVATLATVGPNKLSTVATVATVNVATPQKPPANDPALTAMVQADLSAIADIEGKPTTPADSASGAVIDIGTVRPPGLTPALLAASLALDAQIVAAGLLPGSDSDRHCWPDSPTRA